MLKAIPICAFAFASALSLGLPNLALAADTEEAVETQDTQETEATEEKSEAPIELAIEDHVYGKPDAPITLYEYASFTCPHCAEFDKSVFPLVEKKYIETGLMNMVYREVYFDGAGLLAASLARCVPEEQYYPMVFTLYDTLPTWLVGQENAQGIITELTKLGITAGLPKDDITDCLDNREMQELMIENSQKNMEDDQVTGTPTLIIDGDKPESWDWEALQIFINSKLEDADIEAPEAEVLE